MSTLLSYFFFQAEDGIRDTSVTGVQTCALPISSVAAGTLQHLSDAVAIVLIGVYGLTLLFSMKTHTYLYDAGTADFADSDEAIAIAATPNDSPPADRKSVV